VYQRATTHASTASWSTTASIANAKTTCATEKANTPTRAESNNGVHRQGQGTTSRDRVCVCPTRQKSVQRRVETSQSPRCAATNRRRRGWSLCEQGHTKRLSRSKGMCNDDTRLGVRQHSADRRCFALPTTTNSTPNGQTTASVCMTPSSSTQRETAPDKRVGKKTNAPRKHYPTRPCLTRQPGRAQGGEPRTTHTAQHATAPVRPR
jgi:hypothetical protein